MGQRGHSIFYYKKMICLLRFFLSGQERFFVKIIFFAQNPFFNPSHVYKAVWIRSNDNELNFIFALLCSYSQISWATFRFNFLR